MFLRTQSCPAAKTHDFRIIIILLKAKGDLKVDTQWYFNNFNFYRIHITVILRRKLLDLESVNVRCRVELESLAPALEATFKSAYGLSTEKRGDALCN